MSKLSLHLGAQVRVTQGSALPIEALILGRAPEDAAQMMRRVFNLCGAAQGAAARAALGLEGGAEALGLEARRDHLMKVFISWPKGLGLAARPLPAGWAQMSHAQLARALWGGAEPQDLRAWLGSERGVAPVLRALAEEFAGQSVVETAPFSDIWCFAGENSPASRHADAPLMRSARAFAGQGPFWRALGRVLDATRAPAPLAYLADGTVIAQAARGAYGLKMAVDGGCVTALRRATPTDHLIGSGLLQRALEGLTSRDKAPLLLDILDPCCEWEILDA